ncbi:NAD-dependent epimerase/dehydratase family protein [Vallicoccus soli]|uniref:NAD-dependent epimerase/dehydratase family protein n=1 Tax=Vallicoccus soli TaxID=2339232 RepID=A0A3A3YWY3_9ACTN|nr:NAD-dependent epimerase/dehydratase family protein [Vallicoccus soli]RJK96077.1 NAD-dependent epimerase/dehydratase family protein [Vallicoccus soli]
MGRVVMVTGVSRQLGGRFARALQDRRALPGGERVDRVIGVDVVPPQRDLGATEFVRADIRNPIIARVIARAEVDTVVHLGVIATPRSAGGRSSMKEINVIGTMQLLAACQGAPSVRRLVVKSSASVYGSSAKDPALFTEDMEPRELPRSGFAKDSTEVEGYVRGFARRRADVAVSVLRLANVCGPGVDTALTDYLSMPVVPMPLGFDGRLQLLHEDDALEVLRRCALGQHAGTFNVAGEGVLLMSQAVRRAGRTPVHVPAGLGGSVGQLARRAGFADVSHEQMAFLSHGRVLDCTRAREELGFVPARSTAATWDDFCSARGLGSSPLLAAAGRAGSALARAAGLEGVLPGPARQGGARA